MINIDNYESSNPSDFDISIIQKDVGGGLTTKSDLDIIKQYPNAKSIILSGLNQESFEYFINCYGEQFECISFWKNKLISELSPLGSLKKIKFINYFFNQKATKLWDMKDNLALEGLSIYDFSKLKSIDGIQSAPNLKHFAVGDMVWAGMEIESLEPLLRSSVEHFSWYGKKVIDNDFTCLAGSNIHTLDLSVGHYTMDELAKIVAAFPRLNGTATIPYFEGNVIEKNEKHTYYYLCKRKKTLEKGKDDDKLKVYLHEFDKLVEQYRQ